MTTASMHLQPILLTIASATIALTASAADSSLLAPTNWPAAERIRAEQREVSAWTPGETRRIESAGGIVAATVSPIAVQAGRQALAQGGTAADAAAVTALTQITTQFGSVVSYAGIFTMLYYDAAEERVFSLDAGFNSYRAELDPLTIPTADLGALAFGREATATAGLGRTTLTPGFIAGVEALHGCFGKLEWADLFTPAIWYCENGIEVSPTLFGFFEMRKARFARTEEGRDFLAQGEHETPQIGDRFVQSDLAKTLRSVATQGAAYMYEGAWAQEFVRLVQRDGGKVTLGDLAAYEPIWSEPYRAEVFGHTVHVNGPPHHGAFSLLAGLGVAEARALGDRSPYWENPDSFLDLTRISQLLLTAPVAGPDLATLLAENDLSPTPDTFLSSRFADIVAPALEDLLPLTIDHAPKHSNAIVVVDRDGNIAVVTHTINAVVWGSTGIVVGGIPLPDAAGFQQPVLAAIEPGSRVPHQILDTIVLREGDPVLATASIGASLLPKTLRIVLGRLGMKRPLADILAAPAVLVSFPDVAAVNAPPPVLVPEGAYSADFTERLDEAGVTWVPTPAATAAAQRGTVAAIALDPTSGRRVAVEEPSVMVFAAEQE